MKHYELFTVQKEDSINQTLQNGSEHLIDSLAKTGSVFLNYIINDYSKMVKPDVLNIDILNQNKGNLIKLTNFNVTKKSDNNIYGNIKALGSMTVFYLESIIPSTETIFNMEIKNSSKPLTQEMTQLIDSIKEPIKVLRFKDIKSEGPINIRDLDTDVLILENINNTNFNNKITSDRPFILIIINSNFNFQYILKTQKMLLNDCVDNYKNLQKNNELIKQDVQKFKFIATIVFPVVGGILLILLIVLFLKYQNESE